MKKFLTDVNLNNNRIVNLDNPIDQLDGVNKDFIDDLNVDNFDVYNYNYSSLLTDPPSSGEIRLNSLTFSSATQSYINVTDSNSFDSSDTLDNLYQNQWLRIQQKDDKSKFVIYEITNDTDNTSYHTLNINYIKESVIGGPDSNSDCVIIFENIFSFQNTTHRGLTSNPHNVTKNQIGLGNVDNTSDLNKPISTLTQTALDDKIDLIEKGATNGVATLDSSGQVPSSQLPFSDSERFEAYNSVTTTGFNTSPATINLNQTRINSAPSLFSITSSEVTINENINALVSYRVSTEISSGTSRSTSYAWVEIDTGSGFTEVDGSRVFMYNRTDGNSVNTGSGNVLLDVNSGDVIRLRVQRQDGTDTLNTVIDGCNLSIVDLKGGKQGPQGPQGIDGSPGGPPGPTGPNGYGIFAFSKTDVSGSILDSRGFSSVTLVTTGTYDYVFSTPSDNADYVISSSVFNINDDTNVYISNTTVNGFRVEIGVGDNGDSPDVLTNTEHSIIVINASGGLQGISSAYDSWLNIGNTGTESDFIDSLEGPSDHSGLNLDDGTNPHGTTKTDVGLGNVENISTTNDRAMVELSTTTVITTTTNSPVNGLTYTTKNLGGNGTYLISTSLSRSHNISGDDTRVSIEVGGTVVKEFRTASFAGEVHIVAFSVVVKNIASGTIIRVLSRTEGGTHTITERSLTVDGILDGRVA